MSDTTGVLIDTASIQNYIYSSNRLKDNIGASFLVSNLFSEPLLRTLGEVCHFNPEDFEKWKASPEQKPFEEGSKCDIGYIGGGNALIFFKDGTKAEDFIKEYSKLLLVEAPGVRTAFGVLKGFDLDNFSESMKAIHQNLNRNKNLFHPVVELRKYGITAECPRSGQSAEFPPVLTPEGAEFLSSVTWKKLQAIEQSNKTLASAIGDILGGRFTFTEHVDRLWMIEDPQQHGNESGYVAVVHIDGNRVGEKFSATSSLHDIRKLSLSMTEATLGAFRDTVADLIELSDSGVLKKEDGFFVQREDSKTLLPIRPIVIGGDDITFLCHGKLALYLAESFISNFERRTAEEGVTLTACGGVAIVKTKYPFYRAYELAESLTSRAKRKSRATSNVSCIDFHVSSGGMLGTADEVIERTLSCQHGQLHYGPYRVDRGDDPDTTNHLRKLINSLSYLPRNKLMKLREKLTLDREEYEAFMIELEVSGLELPKVAGFEKLWSNRETPYFDAIEIQDFYPQSLLDWRERR
ncbi:MAG TPA: hypothetical protein DCE14_08655 [Kosmotogaceae bacterium]|nr:hypothetical protein [Kosmotogaceae bacterium]